MGEWHTPCHQLHLTVGTMFLQVFSVQLVSLKNAIAQFFYILQFFLCMIRAGGPSGISLVEAARDETSVPTSSNQAFRCSRVTPLHPHLQSLPAHHCPLLEPPAERLCSEDLSGRGPGAPLPCSAPILVQQLDAESWVWMELQEQLPRLAR